MSLTFYQLRFHYYRPSWSEAFNYSISEHNPLTKSLKSLNLREIDLIEWFSDWVSQNQNQTSYLPIRLLSLSRSQKTKTQTNVMSWSLSTLNWKPLYSALFRFIQLYLWSICFKTAVMSLLQNLLGIRRVTWKNRNILAMVGDRSWLNKKQSWQCVGIKSTW